MSGCVKLLHVNMQSDIRHLEDTLLVLDVVLGNREQLQDNLMLVC